MNLDFLKRTPGCFGIFALEDAIGIKSEWVSGPEFLSKILKCNCGEYKLNVFASRDSEMTLAPVIIECPNCGQKQEVFHPEKHGWDGQNGDNCSLVGEEDPMLFNGQPSKVVAEYSYQGLENYEELIDDGVKNPEDYYDVFALYIADDSGKLTEVVSYECA